MARSWAPSNAIFFNHGQCCNAGSRLYIQKGVFDDVVAGVAEAAKKIKVAPGTDPTAEMGPLISDEQFEKVLGYLDSGREAGAEAVVGGGRRRDRGYFVQPTILTNTNPDMKVVREEIFGPVVCAIPFDSPEEIVPIANDTNYGLAAGVFTRDISKAHRTAKRLRAGTVWINTYHVFDAAMPFGGYKESGWGREMGSQVLNNYLETKSVVTALWCRQTTHLKWRPRTPVSGPRSSPFPARRSPVGRVPADGAPGQAAKLEPRLDPGRAARLFAETGRPPRRNDWTGERPGEAGRAQRKWMLEHPRWPSSSCVSAHFGSWSAALDAADLPVRRLTFESSVSERVEAARRLAVSGLSPREISGLLGVSVSSVHNYIRARDCPDCGGPVTNPHAARCAACAVRHPTVTRAWSRVDVRAAIRAWQAEHGRPPSYRDWTPSRASPGRWEAESPRWPSAAVVCALYRSRPNPWNSALIDAGADVRFQRWSDDSVRSALAGFWIETGRPPHDADLRGPDWHGPRPAADPPAPLRQPRYRVEPARTGPASAACPRPPARLTAPLRLTV